MNMCAGNNM